MVTDERSEYHLQSACLVLAAHKVMTLQLKMSRERSIDAIRQCMGDSSTPGMAERGVKFLLRISAMVSARVQAGSDTFLLLSRAAQSMTDLDWGKGGFMIEHDDSRKGFHVLTVQR